MGSHWTAEDQLRFGDDHDRKEPSWRFFQGPCIAPNVVLDQAPVLHRDNRQTTNRIDPESGPGHRRCLLFATSRVRHPLDQFQGNDQGVVLRVRDFLDHPRVLLRGKGHRHAVPLDSSTPCAAREWRSNALEVARLQNRDLSGVARGAHEDHSGEPG